MSQAEEAPRKTADELAEEIIGALTGPDGCDGIELKDADEVDDATEIVRNILERTFLAATPSEPSQTIAGFIFNENCGLCFGLGWVGDGQYRTRCGCGKPIIESGDRKVEEGQSELEQELARQTKERENNAIIAEKFMNERERERELADKLAETLRICPAMNELAMGRKDAALALYDAARKESK